MGATFQHDLTQVVKTTIPKETEMSERLMRIVEDGVRHFTLFHQGQGDHTFTSYADKGEEQIPGIKSVWGVANAPDAAISRDQFNSMYERAIDHNPDTVAEWLKG